MSISFQKILNIFFLFILSACNSASDGPMATKAKSDSLITEVKELNEVIQDILITESDTVAPKALEHLLSHEDVKQFYERRNWFPAWTSVHDIDTLCRVLMNQIKDADNLGYSPDLFHYTQLRSLIERNNEWNRQERLEVEFLMTDAFLLFYSALKYGIIDPGSGIIVYKAGKVENMPEKLEAFFSSKDPNSYLLSNQSTFPSYTFFRNAYQEYKSKHGTDPQKTHIPDVKVDSIACYRNGILALQRHGYLKHAEADEKATISALKKFQLDHGLETDGRIGKNTSAWLSKSVKDHLDILAVNMEKSKWENFSDSEYVYLNIPAFKLSIIRNDSLIAQHKVIVGTSATPTPELSSKIIYLITFPYWFVPYSISTKEIIPSVRKDPQYLSKKNYTVLNRDREPVDPSTIAWASVGPGNFPYTMRQEGGSDNALGLIKFIFPNIHSVYLHDTPSKPLFNKDIRAFSHGCMRLHRPMDFAAYLMEREENPIQIDSLDTLVKNKIRRQINLKKPLPIHIRYFTVDKDNSGKLIFHTDIYKKDDEIIKVLFPKSGLN